MYCRFSLIIIGIVLIYVVENTVGENFITGKITHNQPNTIDRNAKIEVALRDISLMDVASKLIASTTITDAKTFPVSYKLKYNPKDIQPHNSYAVSVTIKGPDGKLLFTNDVQVRVELTGVTSITRDILVIKVGGSSSDSGSKLHDKKICPPVKCPGRRSKTCPYGYQKKDGCEICRCNDPCNPPGKPILCGPKQRCFVDRKSDGTFGTRCDTVTSNKSKGDKGGKTKSKMACQLPKVTGPCRAALPRFYYNSATKACEQFAYGGCKGNANNFHSKPECEQTCKA